MPTLTPGKSLSQVAEIIHAAVLLGPAAWGREPMPEAHMAADIEDKLKSQLIGLFRILHERKIPYVLVGGIAMLTYVEGRNTKDVDLMLSVESLKLLPEIVVSDQNREFARGKFGELLVDFLITSNPLFKIVEQKYSKIHRFLEMDLQTATIEGLILLKMFALPSLYRQRRRPKIALYENDIYMLYDLGRPQMEPLFLELKPFVEDAVLADLRNIVAEIRQRIERVDRGGMTGKAT
jgi:hypothetical protein